MTLSRTNLNASVVSMGAVHANVRSAIESIGEETNEAQRILPQVASAMYRNKAAILAAVAPELHPVFFAALSLLHLAPKRVGYHVEESSERFVEAVFMVNATMKNYFLYEPFLSKGERKIVAMWDDKKQFKLQSSSRGWRPDGTNWCVFSVLDFLGDLEQILASWESYAQGGAMVTEENHEPPSPERRKGSAMKKFASGTSSKMLGSPLMSGASPPGTFAERLSNEQAHSTSKAANPAPQLLAAASTTSTTEVVQQATAAPAKARKVLLVRHRDKEAKYQPVLSSGGKPSNLQTTTRRKRAAQVDRVLEDHRSFVDDVEGLVKRTAGAESRAVDAPVPGAGGQQRGQLELVAGPPMQFEPEPREVARSKTSSADTGTSEGGKKEEDVALDTMMKELWEIRRSSPTEPGSNPLLLNKNGKSPLSAAAAAVRAGAPTFVHPAPSTKHVDSLIASARDYNASKGSVAASTPMEAAPAVQQVRLSPKEGPYP